jgi:hypothetical protein
MARPTKLGLVFEGAEAEEFLQNENSTVFTFKQLAFLVKRREFIGLIVINSDDRNSGKGAFHTIVKFQV